MNLLKHYPSPTPQSLIQGTSTIQISSPPLTQTYVPHIQSYPHQQLGTQSSLKSPTNPSLQSQRYIGLERLYFQYYLPWQDFGDHLYYMVQHR